MNSIADFKFNTAPLSEGILLVTRHIRQNFPLLTVQEQLQQLVDDAHLAIPAALNQDQKLEILIDLFYNKWKFGGAEGVYCISDTLWLDKVLETRQGSPISLGVIFLHIAHAFNLPLMPVIFPTQLILRADWLDGEMWLINPLNGETLNEHILEVWIKGNLGFTTTLEESDLAEATNIDIVRKVLHILKVVLIDEKKIELALRASETVLKFDPSDPYEIRDRGLIYAQLDCNHIAISDLSYFVAKCPEDPLAEMTKMQIRSIEQQQFFLH